MATAEDYRRKADEAMTKALASSNMAERSGLIGQAAYWHDRAAAAQASQAPEDDPESGDLQAR